MGGRNGDGWTDTAENGVSAESACRSVAGSEGGRRAEIRAHVTRHGLRVTTNERLPDTVRRAVAPRLAPSAGHFDSGVSSPRCPMQKPRAPGARSAHNRRRGRACGGVRRFWDRATKHRPIWGKTAHPGSQRAALPRHITTGQTYRLSSTLLEATSPPTRRWRTASRGWTPHVPHATDTIRPSQTSPALPEPVPDNAVAGRRHRHERPETTVQPSCQMAPPLGARCQNPLKNP